MNKRTESRAHLPLLVPVLLFCLTASFALRGDSNAPPESEESKAVPSPDRPGKILLNTVSASLKTIEKESPVFFRQLERKMAGEKDRLASAFLVALAPELAQRPAEMPCAEIKHPPFHALLLENRRILYLSLGSFSPETKTGLENALRQTWQEQAHLTGIILDLRDAAGDNPLDGREVFSLLSFRGDKNTVQHVPVPILVLTNGNTSGAAEILAKLLEHTRYGLCIGEKTRGEPFPRRAIRSGGNTLHIPLIPKKLGNLTADALIPAVAVAATPRMEIGALRKQLPFTEQSDPSLSRARDLLLSLDTLNQKWRK